MPEPMLLPLPKDADLGFWKSEVDRAEQVRKPHEDRWNENLRYYSGKPLTSEPEGDFVNVNVDFYETEQKSAQLFFETPELQLSALAPLKGQEAILQIHRELLNELLGPTHADVLRTIQKSIKDCLCASGIGATVIGYQPTVRNVQPPEQLGSVLGLTAPVSVPIHDHWYWDRFSTWKLLIPADFRDTDYDQAPWLGMRFRMPFPQAQREFGLPADFQVGSNRDEHVAELPDATGEDVSSVKVIEGVSIWYRAALYESETIHPELYRELVLIDGLDRPARHRDSPHQEINPATGDLTADSLIGNPIHPLTLRDTPDSAYPPSDSEVRRPLVKELCKFRTQMVVERDINQPKFGYDVDAMPPDTLEKIRTGTTGAMIGFEGGRMAGGLQSIFAQLVQGSSPRQTYLANDYITRDLAKTSGLDSPQLGVQTDTERSATEVSQVERASNVRLDAERRRVLDWYLKGVTKFSTLVVRYLTGDRLVKMAGQQGAQAYQTWNKDLVDGRLAFKARPDSQIRTDAAQDRAGFLKLYQMTANDPNVIRVELLKTMFEKYGYDPQRVIATQLPDKGPDPPRIAYSFSGADLDPNLPQFPLVMDILRQGGVQISPETLSQVQLTQKMGQLGLPSKAGVGSPAVKPGQQTEHGGTANQVEPLGKHQFDQTGERSGPKPM